MNTLATYSPEMTDYVMPILAVSPRLINRKLNIIRHAVHVVQKQTGHAANEDVAAYLGVSIDEYNHILQDANTYRLFHSKQEVA